MKPNEIKAGQIITVTERKRCARTSQPRLVELTGRVRYATPIEDRGVTLCLEDPGGRGKPSIRWFYNERPEWGVQFVKLVEESP